VYKAERSETGIARSPTETTDVPLGHEDPRDKGGLDMKRSMTLALGIAVGAGMTGFVNAMQHVKVTELYKADLVTSEGKEASMFLAELAPGANMGKHYHPGDAFAYILEGTMLLEIAGKESVTLKPGQSGSLPPRTVHDDKNASQTAPLKFLVFHVAKKGDPLAVPVQ
jgi:quercetin dioxygenase-like cupin family protein